MNNERDLNQLSIEDALAICLDAIRKDEKTLHDCLEQFPHHKIELERLLKKYIYLNKYHVHSPRRDYKKNGYQQLAGRLSASQSKMSQNPLNHIKSLLWIIC